MTKKPRLLFNNEFSLLSTGFSNIGYEVIKRLYATNKYEIAELASYVSPDDPRLDDVPWKVYPVIPHASDIEGMKAYQSVRTAQFGELKLNETLLDFQPTHVIEIRDPWMSEIVFRNPLRDKYKIIYMTTIDGEPQREDWIDVYKRADVLCTYTKWAANIARKQGINVIDVLSPGTDETVYKPIKNKKEYKESMGLNPDWFIIQTVMRNQGRKLYPELFKAFSLFLEKCRKLGETELANRTYLHIHCSLKDVGWNIVEEIQKYHLSNKVLLTYLDHNSKQADFGLYRGYTAWSRSSNLKSCTTTNTAVGVTREQLAELMQCADLYIQYSVCVDEDTPILTNTGWKPIKTIIVGDRVLTHNNIFEPVLEVFKNDISESDIYKISTKSDIESLICSGDHKIFAIQNPNINTKITSREWIGSKMRDNAKIPDPEFIEASKLRNGDLIVYPIDHTIIDINKIDLASEVKYHKCNDTIIDSKYKKYSRYITVDNEFCRFLGLFVADGTSSGNSGIFRVTYAIHEIDNQELCINIAEKLGITWSLQKYHNRNAININMSSVIHKRYLSKHCMIGVNKQLPEWTIRLPYGKQLEILRGLFMGDGHYDKSRNVSIYCTISKTLCNQIKQLLHRNKIMYNLHISRPNGNRQKQYRFEVSGNVANGEFISQRSSTNNVYYKNYILYNIKTELIPYHKQFMYDICVGNSHSYTTNIGIVHNCEGFGMPIIDAKACGVPVMGIPYSATAELVTEPGGIPLKIGAMFQETADQTSQRRVLPDNEYTANKIFEFFKATQMERNEIGNAARQCVLDNYTWDICAKKWESVIDSVDISDLPGWDSQPLPFRPDINNIPWQMPNQIFVEWAYDNIVGRPWLLHFPLKQSLVTALDNGFKEIPNGMMLQRTPYDKKMLVQELLHVCEEMNKLDYQRFHTVNKTQNNNDNITYARM